MFSRPDIGCLTYPIQNHLKWYSLEQISGLHFGRFLLYPQTKLSYWGTGRRLSCFIAVHLAFGVSYVPYKWNYCRIGGNLNRIALKELLLCFDSLISIEAREFLRHLALLCKVCCIGIKVSLLIAYLRLSIAPVSSWLEF